MLLDLCAYLRYDKKDKNGSAETSMKFSVIVVCLNAGEKLNDTLSSILKQDYKDFEIVVKDGKSKDGSIEKMIQDDAIKLFVEEDKSIYDAMNQAIAHANGEYYIFMNCGDRFHDEKVLSAVAGIIEKEKKSGEAMIVYGKLYNEKSQSYITPSPVITGFTCFRNVPCHQSCIYDAALFKKRVYEPRYKIRADYEHFLWCYYKGGAKMVYLNEVIADYEGGGFSETKENKKRSKAEHRRITEKYMSKGELFKYRTIMALTLAPLRTCLAESKAFSGIYHKLIKGIYRK